MDWLSSNHVLLNCFDKTLVFSDRDVSGDDLIISANQVKASLRENS